MNGRVSALQSLPGVGLAKKLLNRRMLRLFFRDKLTGLGTVLVLVTFFLAVAAPVLSPFPEDAYENVRVAERLQSPSAKHWFGTDRMGRDIFSRVLYGGRVTLFIALAVTLLSIAIGVPLGLVAGYYSGAIHEVIMRVADVFLAIPRIILALSLAAALGPNVPNVIVALSVSFWPRFTRIVEAETQSLRHELYIEASQSLGVSPVSILFRHIFVHTLPTIIVRGTLGIGFTILLAATLGFIGVGVSPPTPEWGLMIAESREYLPGTWWYALFPGLAIFLTVMGYILMGDSLRDAMDPRLRGIEG
ncbi:MAG TPA: ABC transporter permease [bacterium]|nr:ABC transporter permease [bacterium]